MSLFSNIFRRLHRQKIVRRLTAHDLMEKALKISANNVIIYDIPHQHVIKVSGKMLPDEGISVEGFKEHVYPDDLDLVVNSILDLRAGKAQSLEFDYRWNFDYTGGEPRWGWLHNTSVAEYTEGRKRRFLNVTSRFLSIPLSDFPSILLKDGCWMPTNRCEPSVISTVTRAMPSSPR